MDAERLGYKVIDDYVDCEKGCTCEWVNFFDGPNRNIPQRQLNAKCIVHGGRATVIEYDPLDATKAVFVLHVGNAVEPQHDDAGVIVPAESSPTSPVAPEPVPVPEPQPRPTAKRPTIGDLREQLMHADIAISEMQVELDERDAAIAEKVLEISKLIDLADAARSYHFTADHLIALAKASGVKFDITDLLAHQMTSDIFHQRLKGTPTHFVDETEKELVPA